MKRATKISFNPYLKNIEFKQRNKEDWVDLGEKSELIKKQKTFSNLSLQNSIHEILNIIFQEYGSEEIIFEGTDEDYQELKGVLANFYDPKIQCEKSNLYLESPHRILVQIERKYAELENTFQKYESTEISQIIGDFKEVVGIDIPIFVMGTYSSGKSAFINALIGAEVLPSEISVTTAKIYKIVKSKNPDKGQIIFKNNQNEIKILLDTLEMKISGDIDKNLESRITEMIKKGNPQSFNTHIFYCLKAINDYSLQQSKKISDIIEVHVPFNNLLKDSKNNFIIYDSPGSNPASYKEHFKILKDAVDAQTNGLPVVLTTPDNIESNDTSKLSKAFKDLPNLDYSNTVLVINKTDQIGKSDVQKIVENKKILSNWKLNRAYFLSAIMGLSSKIHYSNWLNETYKDPYDSAKSKFEHKGFKLYEYNVMPQNRKDDYQKYLERVSEKELIYINSGLHCIEYEILNFAKKQAYYHKCKKAQDFLSQAIEKTEFVINEHNFKISNYTNELKQKQNKFKDELLIQLSKKIISESKFFIKEYPNYMSKNIANYVDYIGKRIDYTINIEADKVKSIPKGKLDTFQKSFEIQYNLILENTRNEIFRESEKYWFESSEKLKKECCQIVKGDQTITREEQKFLSEFIMNLSIVMGTPEKININKKDIAKPRIQILGLKLFMRDEVDRKSTYKKYFLNAKNEIRRINTIINQEHNNTFKSWNAKLEDGLKSRIMEMNPILKQYSIKIKKSKDEIAKMEEQKKLLKTVQSDIEKLYEYKKVGDN